MMLCTQCRVITLHLHDLYNHPHAGYGITVHGVQHGLGDGLKQVLRLLHTLRHVSQINDPNIRSARGLRLHID